jgi:hypothetical protein
MMRMGGLWALQVGAEGIYGYLLLCHCLDRVSTASREAHELEGVLTS